MTRSIGQRELRDARGSIMRARDRGEVIPAFARRYGRPTWTV
jgi:hypothetical protein